MGEFVCFYDRIFDENLVACKLSGYSKNRTQHIFNVNPSKMKTNRIIAFFFASFVISIGLSAQTADGVINDYLSAIGGKKKLSKISSMQMKSQIESDMFEAEAITTILSGKGFKMEMDVMGYLVETCYTDKEG